MFTLYSGLILGESAVDNDDLSGELTADCYLNVAANTVSIIVSIVLKWLIYRPDNYISSGDHTGWIPHYFLDADTIAQANKYGFVLINDGS